MIGTFTSNYYNRMVSLQPREQQLLYELYIEVAEEQGWKPEIDNPSSIDESHTFDHVAYHVDEFAKDKSGYEEVSHLFI